MGDAFEGKSRRYFLVTAVKDEEENLQKLISSVEDQTVRPFLWVIIDDFSKDNSPQIILRAKEKSPWIHYLRLDKDTKAANPYYSGICRVGFNYVFDYCRENGLGYDYIGLLDADIILPPEYYLTLIRNFEENSKLGIASGGLITKVGNRYEHATMIDNFPSGAARLWRKKCFEETDGYISIPYSSDTVSNIKGQLRGWETRRFENTRVIHTREISGKQGLWKGYFNTGRQTYFLNAHPFLVMARGLYLLSRPPFYISFAYTLGYINAAVKQMKQIDDEEIKRYFWHTRLRKLPGMIVNQLKLNLGFVRPGKGGELPAEAGIQK